MLKLLLRPFARVFATEYFACGDAAARWMYGDRRVDSGRVTVLPNAIDLNRFSFSPESRASVRQEIGARETTLVVGHIGRFMYQKNHAYLLRIFQALLVLRPDAILMLAGEGELLDETRALAKALDIEHRVRFLGVRRDAERLYSAMDVFCLPSFYEGLPVVMVEALANGLSCVVSDQVTRELNEFRVTQLPLDATPARWAQALLESPRAETAPETLIERFDIRTTAKQLEAFYLASVQARS